MPISEICTREVIIAERNETVLQAAKLMPERNVGNVAVVENRDDHCVFFFHYRNISTNGLKSLSDWQI